MPREPRFPLEESQRGWRPEGTRQMFLLPKKLHRPSGKEGNASTSWKKPTELCWDPSGYWLAVPCRRYLSSPVIFHWGYSCSQVVSMLRDYENHDEVLYGEFDDLFSAFNSDWLLISSGQRESLRSIMRPHFFMWACPMPTCAAHSFFPGNLDPNGIISQWPELTLF